MGECYWVGVRGLGERHKLGDVLNKAPEQRHTCVDISAHLSASSHPSESVTRGQGEMGKGKMHGMYDGVMVVDRKISAVEEARRPPQQGHTAHGQLGNLKDAYREKSCISQRSFRSRRRNFS